MIDAFHRPQSVCCSFVPTIFCWENSGGGGHQLKYILTRSDPITTLCQFYIQILLLFIKSWSTNERVAIVLVYSAETMAVTHVFGFSTFIFHCEDKGATYTGRNMKIIIGNRSHEIKSQTCYT